MFAIINDMYMYMTFRKYFSSSDVIKINLNLYSENINERKTLTLYLHIVN